MHDFPTTPGSLIRATAVDDSRPTPYLLVITDDEPGAFSWLNPVRPDEPYRQDELILVEVLHDEGRAQMLADLPAWSDLTDVDKGRALMYAWKVDQEGHEYAVENYPAEFHDHPALAQIRPVDACAYVDRLGIDLSSCDVILVGELELSWGEYSRLYDLALDAD